MSDRGSKRNDRQPGASGPIFRRPPENWNELTEAEQNSFADEILEALKGRQAPPTLAGLHSALPREAVVSRRRRVRSRRVTLSARA
jgi:hypothetical protein